jgi:hypothetical protein
MENNIYQFAIIGEFTTNDESFYPTQKYSFVSHYWDAMSMVAI